MHRASDEDGPGIPVAATPAVAAMLPKYASRVRLLASESDVLSLARNMVILVGGQSDPLFEAVRRRNGAAIMVLDQPTLPLPAMDIDDCLFVPFSDVELSMRIARALQHTASKPAPTLLLESDGVRLGTARVTLSPTQRRLMSAFMDAGDGVLSREDLLLLMGANDARPHAIEARVGRLRQRIEPLKGVRIQTVRQRGYRLVMDAHTPTPGHGAAGSLAVIDADIDDSYDAFEGARITAFSC